MLRHQYNYLLADRFRWWQMNRCNLVIPQGDYCWRWCEISGGELRNNPDWHSQSATLPQLKQERPWYKDIYSQVLQDCVKRVKLAFDRFISGDSKGNRSGRPRFKNKSRYRKKVDGVFVPNGQASSSGMNKSWSDNAVGNFLEILSQVAQKYGTRIVKVNPRGTSQHCSRCLNRVSKTLGDRWHECGNCGLSCDRDYNSALLIKKLAVGSSQDKTLPSLKGLMG